MEDFLKRAVAQSYRSLGFTPHSPLPYETDWAMKEEDLPAYFAEIDRLRALYRGQTEILCGIEWDSETQCVPEGIDYVIGSVHSFSRKGVHFSVDYAREELERVISELYDGSFVALCTDYFDLVASHAVKKQVDVVGHFDLPTKYNKDGSFVDETNPDYLRVAFRAADEILAARPQMLFEINTGVMARAGKKYPYPSEAIFAHLVKRGARFVITGDCHHESQLSVGYEKALEMVGRHCPDRLYLLTGRGFEKLSF